MPWREMSPMDQRLEFVREYETELFTMTELAAQYEISRKTGYKWLERYDAEGAVGLRDRSRRPHESPHATYPEPKAWSQEPRGHSLFIRQSQRRTWRVYASYSAPKRRCR